MTTFLSTILQYPDSTHMRMWGQILILYHRPISWWFCCLQSDSTFTCSSLIATCAVCNTNQRFLVCFWRYIDLSRPGKKNIMLFLHFSSSNDILQGKSQNWVVSKSVTRVYGAFGDMRLECKTLRVNKYLNEFLRVTKKKKKKRAVTNISIHRGGCGCYTHTEYTQV